MIILTILFGLFVLSGLLGGPMIRVMVATFFARISFILFAIFLCGMLAAMFLGGPH